MKLSTPRYAMIGFAAVSTLLMAVGPASSQQPASPAPAAKFTEMAGRWTVEQTTWDGPGTAAKKGPSAIAIRRIPIGGGFVLEEMTSSEQGAASFTRTAQLNYNAPAGAFEYATVDTRAPQLMHYRSQAAPATFQGNLALRGDTFTAAEWGSEKNVAFAYRVELSPVKEGRQRLQLFFRPLRSGGVEFLATEYAYRQTRATP